MSFEVTILLLVDSSPFPIKASSFQGGWNLEAVGRNESSNKTVGCKCHRSPPSKACLVLVDFYSSKASDLTIGSNESPSRLASSLVVDVVGSNVSLVFSDAYKPVKLFVIWNFVPVGLNLTTCKYVSTQILS